ncbi:MAG: hypothetical protein ABIH24_06095 [Verrucomicrobiota bacterium]
MKAIIILTVGLFVIGSVQAQIGSSISADGSVPNDNAMLDVRSPATGDGKGMLIPRVTANQRTNANASLDGGLLNGDSELRGGAAQGLIVYQIDGDQGLYFNASQAVTPAWVYLGTSTTNYLPLTGGTMSGTLNMGGQVVSNVAYIDFNGNSVSVGRGANGADNGAALGNAANGYNSGAAVGILANGYSQGAAMGGSADGAGNGAALGVLAIGTNYGAAMGREANGSDSGAAVGYQANGSSHGAAVGPEANGSDNGAVLGYQAKGTNNGVAVGSGANGSIEAVAVGNNANAYSYGVAIGHSANGTNSGVALGDQAYGQRGGIAIGRFARGWNSGAGLGYTAFGTNSGVAVGYYANGSQTNVAIGMQANAQSGTERIAIGHNVTNEVDGTAVIRGHLYLDGNTGILYRATFGSGAWQAKTFEIDHPLDPENKILRHYCMEGPQVWNVYAGNVQLVNGQAIVQLPDYYSALNLVGSEIYSLTPIGELALLAVGAEVDRNCFTIIGNRDIKISWTIKVLRNDPGCLEDLRRRPVEQWKR